ncbi:MAG: bile acid:sodium symporter family protein, partial [Pseudomonadota bacterium]|nr:bile acid:sodium symporter family protein [Pseudomonadota bacterium]
MSTLGMVQLLFVALALVMAGLGLSLRVEDFRGLQSQKRNVVVALVLQMVLLPLIALALVFIFRLPSLLAVGMVLLAATPGSISANLYSHLFGGNVAFNIALTGLNTFLCALTLPLLTGWGIGYFTGTSHLMPV